MVTPPLITTAHADTTSPPDPPSTSGVAPLSPVCPPLPARACTAPPVSDGAVVETSELPLAPRSSWRPGTGIKWGAVPAGKRRSPAYAYFRSEFKVPMGGMVNPGQYICVHKDHKGLPSRASCVTLSSGMTNLLRHLKDHHGVDLTTAPTTRPAASVPGMVSVEPTRAFQGPIAGQGQLPMFFKSQKTFHPTHPVQKAFNERQVDMVVSTLCPESIVDDEAYVSMIFAANPRLTVASRSTLSRAVTSRFKRHQLRVRTSLKDLDVCHVNSDMWTSTANDAYGSFVVSFISSGWELETCVLRCCIVEGRHTALAIAAFLLQIARDFGLSSKIGVVRTDGASNCVAAGVVLGDVGGRQDLEAGHVEEADGLAMGL